MKWVRRRVNEQQTFRGPLGTSSTCKLFKGGLSSMYPWATCSMVIYFYWQIYNSSSIKIKWMNPDDCLPFLEYVTLITIITCYLEMHLLQIMAHFKSMRIFLVRLGFHPILLKSHCIIGVSTLDFICWGLIITSADTPGATEKCICSLLSDLTSLHNDTGYYCSRGSYL